MSEQIFVNCGQGGPVKVYVNDGKIVRIRPLSFDSSDGDSWKIEARGHSFAPPRKVCLPPYSMTERSRAYSEERIQYPMIMVDFDPN